MEKPRQCLLRGKKPKTFQEDRPPEDLPGKLLANLERSKNLTGKLGPL